jgi:hypothetical protein
MALKDLGSICAAGAFAIAQVDREAWRAGQAASRQRRSAGLGMGQRSPRGDAVAWRFAPPMPRSKVWSGRLISTWYEVSGSVGYLPGAEWMQRAMADLSVCAELSRPAALAGPWRGPEHSFDAAPTRASPGRNAARRLPFVRRRRRHEIAVGRAPGHHRAGSLPFSVVGEKVLRLEEHLGYVLGHERRLPSWRPWAHRLPAGYPGTTVAYAWAWHGARVGLALPDPGARDLLRIAGASAWQPPGRPGALGATPRVFRPGPVPRARGLQRMSKGGLRARFMMDAIVPGGVAIDLSSS